MTSVAFRIFLSTPQMEIQITLVAPQLTNGPEKTWKSFGTNFLSPRFATEELFSRSFPPRFVFPPPEHDLMRKYVKMFKIETSGQVLQRLEIKVQ